VTRSGTTILRLSLAILGVLAAGLALFAGGAGAEAQRTTAAPLPRVSLTIPPELTRGAPALARGKVTPPQRGRILLQVRKAGAWQSVAAGEVRRGRFRISFVPRALPSPARMRAALMRGRRLIATSAVDGIRIGLASPAPAPVPQPPVASATTGIQTPATSSSGGQSTPPAQSPPPEETPLPGEEPPTETPPPGDAYWGAWIGSHLTGTAAPCDMSAVTKFEQMTGKPLSMIEFSSPFSDCSKSPCSYYTFPWDPFNSVRAHGAIPFFSWGSQAIPGTPTQPDFQLADIIAGAHDSYIRAWATRAAEWGHPFFLRFDWEMNGNWFPWGEGVNGNQPGEFAAAWRHVHDIFTSVGATNASWVWCPYVNHLNLYATLYPGDSYVDWTCLDGYNWGQNPAAPYGWSTFDELYGAAYAKVTETLAPAKPMVIGEIASSEYGGSKATWIEEMFEALPTEYPQIRGLLWFETLSNGMDWPLESSESATEAFATGIGDSRYLSNEFGLLSASPIPAP
jgi:mannan endo-1,4-beta-mannosidase